MAVATNRWVGEAVAVAQVDTWTIAETVEIGDLFILTVVGWDGSTEVISHSATSTTKATVATELAAQWNASTHPECAKITAAGVGDTVTLTADTAGVAFTVTGATTEANGDESDSQTFEVVKTTANVGPSDWSSAANWSNGTMPVDTDNKVYVEGAFTILYGLAQSAVELDELWISGAQIGTNPASGWAPVYLDIECPIVHIGHKHGPSALTQQAPINLDTGTVASAITVHNTGTNGSAPAVRLLCACATTTVEVRKGTVGIANDAGEQAILNKLTLLYDTNRTTDAKVYVGAEVTFDTGVINQEGGELRLRSTCATVTIEEGAMTIDAAAAMTTLTINGGTVTHNSSGTLATVAINGGTLDMTKSGIAQTLTNCQLNTGGTLKHDPALSTITTWTEPTGPVSLRASAA